MSKPHWSTQDPKNLRVLLCNDDGIDSPGIAALEKFANDTFGEVWVIAPATEQSAKSRALTVRTPVSFEQRDDRRLAVHGTPVDCMIVALNGILKDAMPDLVLSGINNGANMAEDVGYSGTIGCAFEAMLEHIPAIALSQCYLPDDPKNTPWKIAESHLSSVIELIRKQEPSRQIVYNVNFPPHTGDDISELVWTAQGRREVKQSVDFSQDESGNGSMLIRQLRTSAQPDVNTDLSTVRQGRISITSLAMEQCLSLRPIRS